ncbi:MAG: hypothetical protein LBT48_02425 [Prevotellaceae bacterium]|jgi:nicotinamidase-related amidase|nr:hypothetical protein [Prevotellaceae bacterium]
MLKRTTLLTLAAASIFAACGDAPDTISLSLRQREKSGDTTIQIEYWTPAETAIIICDMWDKHWCLGATQRVAEIAPAMNRMLDTARRRGVTIVHAPSDCMTFYKDYPQRTKVAQCKDDAIAAAADGSSLPSEEGAAWPIEQSDGGCDSDGIVNDQVWRRQIETLTIAEPDVISDSGEEIGVYFQQHGIKNVILVGVHTNMCIVGRSFGLRAMTRMDMNVALMRDMTDLMYNPQQPPYVSHFEGLDLMIGYIEQYICPTVLSTDFTGEPPFLFSERALEDE